MKKVKKYALGGLTTAQDMMVPQQNQTVNTEPNYWNSQITPGISQNNQNLRSSMQDLGITKFKKGGKVSSVSKRADGCVQRGKTRGKMV